MAPRPASGPAPGTARTAGAPQAVRIIGGQWKRTPLPVAHGPGVPAGLRPTPARVRETLFNWLGQDLTGWQVVDAFAGTGALGFEAASRGAGRVVLLETHPRLVSHLRQAAERLQATQVQVQRADALGWLGSQGTASWDLVLLDPPYGSDLLGPALQAAARITRPRGWVYAESATRLDESALQPLGLQLYRHERAGAVQAHLLRQGAEFPTTHPTTHPTTGPTR